MKKVVGRKEKFGSSSKREARFFWKGILFASPWLIGFVCFILLPVCLAFYYSFISYLGSLNTIFEMWNELEKSFIYYMGSLNFM